MIQRLAPLGVFDRNWRQLVTEPYYRHHSLPVTIGDVFFVGIGVLVEVEILVVDVLIDLNKRRKINGKFSFVRNQISVLHTFLLECSVW